VRHDARSTGPTTPTTTPSLLRREKRTVGDQLSGSRDGVGQAGARQPLRELRVCRATGYPPDPGARRRQLQWILSDVFLSGLSSGDRTLRRLEEGPLRSNVEPPTLNRTVIHSPGRRVVPQGSPAGGFLRARRQDAQEARGGAGRDGLPPFPRQVARAPLAKRQKPSRRSWPTAPSRWAWATPMAAETFIHPLLRARCPIAMAGARPGANRGEWPWRRSNLRTLPAPDVASPTGGELLPTMGGGKHRYPPPGNRVHYTGTSTRPVRLIPRVIGPVTGSLRMAHSPSPPRRGPPAVVDPAETLPLGHNDDLIFGPIPRGPARKWGPAVPIDRGSAGPERGGSRVHYTDAIATSGMA